MSEAESTYPATATDHGPEDRKVGRPLVVFLVRLSQDCVELSREEAEWSGGECEVVGCPRHQRHIKKSRVAARTADRGRKGGRTKLRGNFKSCEQDPDLIDFSAFRDGSISLVGSGRSAHVSQKQCTASPKWEPWRQRSRSEGLLPAKPTSCVLVGVVDSVQSLVNSV